MASSKRPLRVLIAGAGVAGLATAISLTRISGIPDLDIQLFEQSPELREIGASIALSPNGLRTLERLGVDSALSDEVGFRGPSGIPHIYRHWKTNQVVSVDTFSHQVRGSFYPDYKLRFSGKVFMRSTFDASLVEGKVPDLPADAAHWWGTKDTFFASRLGKGLYTVVGAYDDGRSVEELEKSITWDQAGNVQFLKEKYKDWHPVIKGLTELTPHARLYPNYAGDALPSWVPAPRVTLVGDAAHTHGGSFAAGGSLALDDSLALGLAFKHIFSSGAAPVSFSQENIKAALGLYDETRRPHTARLLSIVHGLINRKVPTFATPEEEDEALRARMRNRPDLQWLSEHDVEEAFAQVAAKYEQQRSSLSEAPKTLRSGHLLETALRAVESKL
ncbi:hypothetical protein MKX07_004424 [Trichoderma sp. CBMAI-0711]|nr:hypothetical protein MKX07_004424 [Trichoderma sp. CBMAI-0711]